MLQRFNIRLMTEKPGSSSKKDGKRGSFYLSPFSAPWHPCFFGKSAFDLSWELK
jgi:hypothetical protein